MIQLAQRYRREADASRLGEALRDGLLALLVLADNDDCHREGSPRDVPLRDGIALRLARLRLGFFILFIMRRFHEAGHVVHVFG